MSLKLHVRGAFPSHVVKVLQRPAATTRALLSEKDMGQQNSILNRDI